MSRTKKSNRTEKVWERVNDPQILFFVPLGLLMLFIASGMSIPICGDVQEINSFFDFDVLGMNISLISPFEYIGYSAYMFEYSTCLVSFIVALIVKVVILEWCGIISIVLGFWKLFDMK